MSNYFIHIPKTAGNSILKGLKNAEINCIRHDLRSAGYKHPSEICTSDDYVFTFVRNPYSRLLSAYYYLLKGGLIQDDAKDAYYLGIRKLSFLKFIEKRLLQASEWQIHFIPQSFFLQNVPNPVIFYYEDLQNSFNNLCLKFNIPYTDLPRINITEWERDMRTHYTPEAIKIVNQIYASDFDAFNYPNQLML
jgi:chondroitin 4-sulfotransferase 11